jgi:hypothetical protein
LLPEIGAGNPHLPEAEQRRDQSIESKPGDLSIVRTDAAIESTFARAGLTDL